MGKPTQKRVHLDGETKKKVIDEGMKKVPFDIIAKKYGIKQRTVQRIIQKPDQYLNVTNKESCQVYGNMENILEGSNGVIQMNEYSRMNYGLLKIKKGS